MNNKKNMKGYVTLVVVIMFVPFLLMQGINLVHMSIDIVHISSNSVSSNKQYIDEQTCWEEILYFFRNNSNILGAKSINLQNTSCDFFVEELEQYNYKITLESHREGFFSTSERYIFYDQDELKFLTLP
jgi:hypothetical protein